MKWKEEVNVLEALETFKRIKGLRFTERAFNQSIKEPHTHTPDLFETAHLNSHGEVLKPDQNHKNLLNCKTLTTAMKGGSI